MNILSKLKAKLKALFTLTPEEIQHAENELRFIFGLKEKKPAVTEAQEWQILPMKDIIESEIRAKEGLIRKGLIRKQGNNIALDIKIEDCKAIIERLIFLEESHNRDVIWTLAFYALAMVNKFTDITEDELMYFVSMALANGESFNSFLKRIMS